MTPGIVYPDPVTDPALTVTAAFPVEERVKVCVADEPTDTLPNAMVETLIDNVGDDAFNCKLNVCDAPLAAAVMVAV